MKRTLFLLATVFLACCSGKERDTNVAVETTESPVETGSTPRETHLKPVHAENLDKSLHAIADRVLVYETDWKYDTDSESGAMLKYRLEFVKSGQTVARFSGEIRTDKGAEWGIIPNIIKAGDTEHDPRFIEVSHGFAACGYVWHHFLFFVHGNGIQQVLSYESVSDGGFGTSTDYFPTFESGNATRFSTVRVDISEAENTTEENEILEISYSDSTDYTLVNGNWKAVRVTPEEKVYRKRTVPFREYYKTE